MIARGDIRRPKDLRGNSIGVTRPGDLSARQSRQVVRKFGMTAEQVIIHPIGGSQNGRYQAKAAIAKVMRVQDEEALQSSYNVYAKEIVDRTMTVPGRSVSEAVEIARETGTVVRRKPEELYDNSFVLNLEKSGFLKDLWGGENYRR